MLSVRAFVVCLGLAMLAGLGGGYFGGTRYGANGQLEAEQARELAAERAALRLSGRSAPQPTLVNTPAH